MVLYAIFLHRFVARANAKESNISAKEAIDAVSLFSFRREVRARRLIVWRHGKAFFAIAVLAQLAVLCGALVVLFFVVLRAIYAGG